MVAGEALLLGGLPQKTAVTTHLCSLGLAGVGKQRVTHSLVFGHVDAGVAHVILKHGHAALLLHNHACG